MRRRRPRHFAVRPADAAAVNAYLNRKFDSFDWLKEAPRAELLEHCRRLGHRFASDPWHNQLVCFAIGAVQPEFAFFLKMGGGKSKILLDLIRYRKRLGHLDHALIVVPYLIHVASWEEQIREHAPDLTYEILLGDRQQRANLIQRKADLFVINYAGLQVYMGRRGKVRRKNGDLDVKVQIDAGPAGEFASLFNFVAYDESHWFGNDKSFLFECGRWLSMAAPFRYLTTGTPFGRDPFRLWPQFYLMDHGLTLGQYVTHFRRAFYVPKDDYWAASGFKWVYNQEMNPALHQIIKHRSITYELRELRDMPPKVLMKMPVTATVEQAAYYKRITDGVAEARGDYRSLENIYLRMRQCASGFLSLRADDESRIQVEFKDNPKLAGLRDFILSKEDKMLVFHEFIYSGRAICKMLEQMRVGFAALSGATENPAAEYQRFLKDPKCRVFVLNTRIGAEAINPQYVCRRAVFYESPDDPIRRAQAEARVHRPGQKWPTFIYDLFVRRTVEERIRRFVLEGQSLWKAILSGEEYLDEDIAPER